MGLRIICTDARPHAPGLAFADIGVVTPPPFSEANLRVAEEYRPDAVVPEQSDIAVPAAAFVAHRMGLPGIGIDKAKLFTDKFIMREFCREHGFPSPPFKLCRKAADVRAFADENGWPVVIKPRANQSSRGVHVVSSPDLLDEDFADAVVNGAGDGVLVEKFVGGSMHTVEGIKLPSRHYTVAVSRKDFFPESLTVARSVFYSFDDPGIDYGVLKQQNDRLVEAMGLPFGLTHAEYKYHDNCFYLLEIAARGGGGMTSTHVVPAVTGYDTTGLLLQMSLGEAPAELPAPAGKARYASIEFFLLSSGKIRSLSGLDEIKAVPGVIGAEFYCGPGDVIVPPKSGVARPGHFVVAGNSRKEVLDLARLVQSMVRVEYYE